VIGSIRRRSGYIPAAAISTIASSPSATVITLVTSIPLFLTPVVAGTAREVAGEHQRAGAANARRTPASRNQTGRAFPGYAPSRCRG